MNHNTPCLALWGGKNAIFLPSYLYIYSSLFSLPSNEYVLLIAAKAWTDPNPNQNIE